MEPHWTPARKQQRLVVRTVLDLRSGNGKYLCQTLLLVASWHKHAAAEAGLEVLTIGDASRELQDFLQTLGVRHVRIEPGANDAFSKHSNKIAGAGPDAKGRRVLLLDNDTCFLGSVAELSALPSDAIAAAEAGRARVSDAQWESIRDGIGLALRRGEWAPFAERLVEGESQAPALRERWLYLNSGVILFPAGRDHGETWLSSQRAINDHFRGHPLATDAVTTSDQAGFASSIAAHGEFAWLPARFNYRPPCFCLGLEAADGIRILHFTADGDNADRLGMTERIDEYWHRCILSRIDRLPASLPETARAWRREQAILARGMVQDVISEYGLDALRGILLRSSFPHAEFA